MTTPRLFFLSLAGLVVASCGLLGFVYIAFRYFTYQGNGMNWIYPAAGFFCMLWLGSACTALFSLVKAVVEYIRRKRGLD